MAVKPLHMSNYTQFVTWPDSRVALFEARNNGMLKAWEVVIRQPVKLTASADAYVSPHVYRVQ